MEFNKNKIQFKNCIFLHSYIPTPFFVYLDPPSTPKCHTVMNADFVITFLLDQLTCKNHSCKKLNVICIALSPRSPPPTLWVDCLNDYMYKEYPHSLLTIVPKCQVPAKSCMLSLRIGKSCLII